MSNKCDCYETTKRSRHTLHITAIPVEYEVEVGICNGTRERDECSCGGDRTKCDFYPEVRARAKREATDKILTRADQIRAMTDKELAKFLLDCDMNDLGFCHVGICLDGETCVECISKWLKQPTKE